MLENVSEDKDGLKNYLTSNTWCSFHTKKKFEKIVKSEEGKSRLKRYIISPG